MRWIVSLLALSVGGFMLTDGLHGFATGRYITPAGSDAYGPWAGLVEGLGLTPDSTLMRAIFVVHGLAWLAALVAYLRRRPGARPALLGLSVATLWYLTIGTVHCVLVLALLLGVPSLRERA